MALERVVDQGLHLGARRQGALHMASMIAFARAVASENVLHLPALLLEECPGLGALLMALSVSAAAHVARPCVAHVVVIAVVVLRLTLAALARRLARLQTAAAPQLCKDGLLGACKRGRVNEKVGHNS